jgi:uncharacterized membrane protein
LSTTTTTPPEAKSKRKSASAKSVAKPKAKKGNRFWEIDTLRGVAIVMMIIFHLMWDLWFFGARPETILYTGFWKYFQRTIPILFLSLAGISLTLSYRFSIRSRGNSKGLFRKFLWRGLKVFGLGMIITIAVWAAGTGYVHFGILHLIGFSIIAAYPFLRYRWVNLVLWILFVIGGYFLQDLHIVAISSAFGYEGAIIPFLETNPAWLAWLGIIPRAYAPVDYFPVIPWFGVVLLGVFLGNTFYTTEGRTFYLPDYSNWLPTRFLSFLGRHSLIIYVIHQPILIASLYVLGIIRF